MADWDSESEDDSAEADFRIRSSRLETDEFLGMVSMRGALGVVSPTCGLHGVQGLHAGTTQGPPSDLGQQRLRAEESFLLDAESRRLPFGHGRQKRRKERGDLGALSDGGLLTPPAGPLPPLATQLQNPRADSARDAPKPPVNVQAHRWSSNSSALKTSVLPRATSSYIAQPHSPSVALHRASSSVVIKAATLVRDATVTSHTGTGTGTSTGTGTACVKSKPEVPPSIEQPDLCTQSQDGDDLGLPTVHEGLEETGSSLFVNKPRSAIDGRSSAPPRVGALPARSASVQPRSPSVQPRGTARGSSMPEESQRLPFAVLPLPQAKHGSASSEK